MSASLLFQEDYIPNSICDKHYKPLYEPQLDVMRDPSIYRLMVSANRFGKTHMGMSEILMCARGSSHLELPTDHRAKTPASELWVGCKNQDSYKRFHEPAFEELCPRAWLVQPKLKTDNYADVRWHPRHQGQGGREFCRIWFIRYDQDVDSLVGQAVDGVWFDEEPPRPHVTEAQARIASTDGWMMITFTPILGLGWWHQGLWLPALAGRSAWSPHRGALAERDKSNKEEYEVGRVLVPHFRRIYDPITRTTRPNPACTCNEEGYCQACRQRTINFASGYPDIHDRLVRIFGHVRGKQGLIHKPFEPKIHVIEPFELTGEYELWGAIDPGFRGRSVIFGALDPQGRVFIVDELFAKEQSYADMFNNIAARVRRLRPGISDWPDRRAMMVFYIDTADPQTVLELNIQAQNFVAEQVEKGESLIVDCSFVQLKQGLKAKLTGIQRVNQYLEPRKRNKRPGVVKRKTPEAGEPMLYFFNSLHAPWRGPDQFHDTSRVLWEIEQYKWKPPPRNSTAERDEPDKDSAQGAHGMDTLRYFIMARLAGEEEFAESLLEGVRPPEEGLPPWERDKWAALERDLKETAPDDVGTYLYDEIAEPTEYAEYW